MRKTIICMCALTVILAIGGYPLMSMAMIGLIVPLVVYGTGELKS